MSQQEEALSRAEQVLREWAREACTGGNDPFEDVNPRRSMTSGNTPLDQLARACCDHDPFADVDPRRSQTW